MGSFLLGGKGNQVGGVRRHDLILAPVEIAQGDRHVVGGAYIEADGQAMKFPHGDVFRTAPDQLFPCAENFRADESGHVVHMEPCSPGMQQAFPRSHASRGNGMPSAEL